MRFFSSLGVNNPCYQLLCAELEGRVVGIGRNSWLLAAWGKMCCARGMKDRMMSRPGNISPTAWVRRSCL